eukprot:TRINITY_DN26291_c0_g1_i1.p1 TRINITY_DN26291_c0_g1~~TRINITY_DN26291_c0_g1_i1.p1  ORF type:complete len:601 (+),score=147.27 TRINITY_DN26291_c0_g1_i1:80-1882(+)
MGCGAFTGSTKYTALKGHDLEVPTCHPPVMDSTCYHETQFRHLKLEMERLQVVLKDLEGSEQAAKDQAAETLESQERLAQQLATSAKRTKDLEAEALRERQAQHDRENSLKKQLAAAKEACQGLEQELTKHANELQRSEVCIKQKDSMINELENALDSLKVKASEDVEAATTAELAWARDLEAKQVEMQGLAKHRENLELELAEKARLALEAREALEFERCKGERQATELALARDLAQKYGAFAKELQVPWGAVVVHNAVDVNGRHDLYCVARVGAPGSSWSSKDPETGHRSELSCDEAAYAMAFLVYDQGYKELELHVRVFDNDPLDVFHTENDFLGELRLILADQTRSGSVHTAVKQLDLGNSNRAHGSLRLRYGPPEMLSDLGAMTSPANRACMMPIGQRKQIRVSDISSDGPFRLGRYPLPEALQGLFWVMYQGNSLDCVSFGGPSHDGGGCSTGRLVGAHYTVRVSGDCVWGCADEERLDVIEAVDLVYHFQFDNALEPCNVLIYPEMKVAGSDLSASEWVVDSECVLVQDDDSFPGSMCWQRRGAMHDNVMVQVMDGAGNHIEPAWSKFKDHMQSKLIYSHEIDDNHMPLPSVE